MLSASLNKKNVLPFYFRLLQWMIDEVSPIDLRTESAVVLGSLSKGTDENINSIVDAGCVSVLLKGQYQSNYYFLNLILHFPPTPFLQYTCYSVTCIYLHIAHKCMIQANTHWKGKEMFYLTTHSTHFIYGCMASDIW